MQRQGTMWHYLAVLAVLASCGLDVFAGADADKKEAPKPLPRGDRQGLARHRRERRLDENGPG